MLTEALLRPLRPDHHAVTVADARHLSAQLTRLVSGRPGAGPFRLTDYTVRAALGPDRTPAPTPFAWSAATARRPIGLAAVRSLVAGSARSPVEAVSLAARDAIGGGVPGHRPSSSLDRWLAGLSPAGRAAVQAEAVTWATRLWAALEWEAFATPPTIGRDHWWDSPDSSLLALRSRAEVRATGADGRGNPVSVHLVVLGGPRRATVRSELAVVALVEALRTGAALPPGRIVGWWPESGHRATADVDRNTLAEGVATVARALDRLEAPGTAA
ncbi:MAG: hypothetical protein ACLPVF_15745 [Acidimicrobiales bacterium]